VIGTPLIDGGVAQHSVSRFEKPTKVRGTGRRGAQKFNNRHEQEGRMLNQATQLPTLSTICEGQYCSDTSAVLAPECL